jgi:hypothetical protein
MKTKMKNLLLGSMLFSAVLTYAQDDEKSRECDRMRFLGSKAVEAKSWNEAAIYYIKGEDLCGNYDQKQYSILIGSLIRTINAETDKARKTAYTDTILGVYDRAEAINAYDQADDLYRAVFYLQASKPDNEKADKFFVRGIATQGTQTKEAYVSYYYYNLYTLWYKAGDDKKPELKKRMISDYFKLSKLVADANMSVKAQENLTSYFNNVVKSCDDILPELKGFMGEFSQDPAVKKSAVQNFLNLLESKNCTESAEYIQLIDTLVDIDPNSFDAQIMKSKAQVAKKDYRGAISTLQTAKGLTTDAEKKEELTYEIANIQYNMGSYSAAYSTAMSVNGKFRGKALIIAGKSVGQNANSCGDSTFERKCNNIYAVQLLQQGGADGGTIATYKSRYPNSDDCFQNGNPASVTLSCYGVSVSPCN